MKILSITKDNQFLSLEQALGLTEFPLLYDPEGLHTIESDAYIQNLFTYLKRKGFIDDFQIDKPAEIDPVPRDAVA